MRRLGVAVAGFEWVAYIWSPQLFAGVTWHIFSLVNIRRLVCRQLNKQAREQACVIKVCRRPADTFLNT